MTAYEYNVRLNADRMPILREMARYAVDGRKNFNTPQMVADLAVKDIGLSDAAEEYVYILVTDAKNKLLGLFECGHGAIDQSIVDVRGIFQKVLMLGGTGFFMVHNHPSGDPTPSSEDVAVTDRLKNGAAILGLKLLDHVIIGNGNYVSLSEMGVM